MIDPIRKYARAFLVTAALAGAFAFPATPVFARDDQAAPARAQNQQTFQVSGTDSQRGPFSGQITLTQRDDGGVDVQRQVTFQQSGQTLVQAGTGQQRGNEVRARLTQQAPEQGLSGSVGAIGEEQAAPAQQEEARLRLQVDPEQGTCRGQCASETGTSREQGQQVLADQAPADQALPARDQASPSPARDQASPTRDQALPSLGDEAPATNQASPSPVRDQASPTRDQALPSLGDEAPSQQAPSQQAPSSQQRR